MFNLEKTALNVLERKCFEWIGLYFDKTKKETRNKWVTLPWNLFLSNDNKLYYILYTHEM